MNSSKIEQSAVSRKELEALDAKLSKAITIAKEESRGLDAAELAFRRATVRDALTAIYLRIMAGEEEQLPQTKRALSNNKPSALAAPSFHRVDILA